LLRGLNENNVYKFDRPIHTKTNEAPTILGATALMNDCFRLNYCPKTTNQMILARTIIKSKH
jgi:hypothetical protein